MVVLALDTVSRAGSLALLERDALLERVGDASRTHGERLPAELLDLLAERGLTPAAVDLYAVLAGPGSFTGLRVGIATIQGMAMASRRRVVAVPTLEAVVAAWRHGERPSAEVIVPCIDGQRGDVFYAAYDQVDADPVPAEPWPVLIEPSVGRPEELADVVESRLGRREVAIVGSGAERYADVVSHVRGARIETPRWTLAAAAAKLAARRSASSTAPHAVHPMYIRRPDAVIARERRARQSASGSERAPVPVVVELARGREDLIAVEQLQRSAFAEAWGTEAFEREFANRDVARVYVLRLPVGEVIGYCACWLVADELHINSLAVAGPWRRRRLGTTLLQKILADARQEGVRCATLEVRESNTAARGMYERLGFRVEGVRRDYYQAPREDAVILWNRSL